MEEGIPVEKSFSLNSKEYLLYKILLEAKPDTVQFTKIMDETEMSLSHMRVTKRNLSRLLEGWAEINAVYGNGYRLMFQ